MITIQFYGGYLKLYTEWVIRSMTIHDFRRLLRLMIQDSGNIAENLEKIYYELEHSYKAQRIDVKRHNRIMHWLTYYGLSD